MADNTIAVAGKFLASTAVITTYAGASLEIAQMIQQIEIFEDLYSPFITIELEVKDGNGLIHKTPFIGEELVTLTITDPDGKEGIIDGEFFIYKIKDKVQVSDRGFVYRICCISTEAIVDLNLKISKAYTGQPSDIVARLLKDEGFKTNKDIFVEESLNSISYISNYWSPLKNIKYIADRTVSRDNKAPSYVFFENKKGFAFTSIDQLVAQKSSASFSFSVGGIGDVKRGFDRIEKIYIDSAFDYIDRIRNGSYGNNSLIVDPTKKTYQYGYYDFIDSFDNFSRLNPRPFGSDNATRKVNAVFTTRVAPSMAFAGMSSERNEDWYAQRITELGAISTFNIEIEVAGRMNLSVGSVVEIYLYSGEIPQDGSARNDFLQLLDKIYSGRYLITALKSTLNTERHTMNIALSKDSIIKAL